jgi:hypothetical protein
MRKGADAPADIPYARRFDLHHLGPQSGQQFGAEGARYFFAEIQNANIT